MYASCSVVRYLKERPSHELHQGVASQPHPLERPDSSSKLVAVNDRMHSVLIPYPGTLALASGVSARALAETPETWKATHGAALIGS